MMLLIAALFVGVFGLFMRLYFLFSAPPAPEHERSAEIDAMWEDSGAGGL